MTPVTNLVYLKTVVDFGLKHDDLRTFPRISKKFVDTGWLVEN